MGIGQPRPFTDDPRAGFYACGAPTPNQNNAPELTEGYTETYEYDPAGNMLRLGYQALSGQWTRCFGMAGQTPDQWAHANSNRLTSLVNGPDTLQYQFDTNGNLIHQNTEKHHTWDHADRMIGFRVQPDGSNSVSIEARYLYGADGMRVKKWVRRGNGSSHDASIVYIDGIFEHNRWQKDGGGQTNALHVMNDQSRIAMVRVGAAHSDDAGPAVQYHLGDHLGSSHVVVGGDDARGHAFINHEEYFPYGETSFGSFGRKRFRYSGKERDEESGLYYHGARHLAPWMARWVSCDPAGPLDGVGLYSYVRNNPLLYVDSLGYQAEEVPTEMVHFVEAVQERYSMYAQDFAKSNPRATPSQIGEYAARTLQDDISEVFGKDNIEVKYSAVETQHRIDVSLKQHKLDIELKLHDSSVRVTQKRVFIDKAVNKGRALAYVTSDGYWVANFGGKVPAKTLDSLRDATKRFKSKMTSSFPDTQTDGGSPSKAKLLKGAVKKLGTAGDIFEICEVSGNIYSTTSEKGALVGVAQAGKESAKVATGYLWFALGTSVALSLASGGLAAPLAALAGAAIVAGGTTLHHDAIDEATPNLR
jgi:RHS repeat-associated protein